MACGIYLIRNRVTDCVYIGQSGNIAARLGQHQYMLRNGKHFNKHLQASWDKHGSAVFVFSELQLCAAAHLTAYENSYLSYYRTLPGGVYNQIGPAESPRRGSKHTPEAIAAWSAKRRGRKLSEETKERLRQMFIGRSLPQSWKDNISKAKRGVTFTDAHRQALSEAHKGKPLSEKHRQSMSRTNRGRPSHPHTRAGHRAWLLRRGPPVARVDPVTGDVLEIFPVLADVKRKGYTPGSVALVLRGKQRTHAGFSWVAVTDKDSNAADYSEPSAGQ